MNTQMDYTLLLSLSIGPYGTPRSVRTSVTGTTTANISWVSPDPSLQNGIILYYTVVLADLMLGMPDRVYNTTQTSFSFTGLEEYGRYGCRVAAATIGGPGPLSTSVQFITFEDSKWKNSRSITHINQYDLRDGGKSLAAAAITT